MKFTDFLKKPNANGTKSRFSDFFLNAPPEKKERLFTDAAKRANKDQQEVLQRSSMQVKKAS